MKNYISKWNFFMKDWLQDPKNTFDRDTLASNHKGKGSKALLHQYLPQPYLGNPERCSAITLNLNPGTSIPARKYPDGALVAEFKSAKDYFHYAKDFPQLKLSGKSSFWGRQLKWINQIGGFNDRQDQPLPFAIELCHWHSAKWKDFDYANPEIREIIMNNIFSPIDKVLTNATLKTVLSVGKTYNHIFEGMGFKKLIEITPDNFKEYNIEYPLNSKNTPTKRFYTLWESDNGTRYLNTYSIGSNRPPSKKWSTIEQYIIKKDYE